MTAVIHWAVLGPLRVIPCTMIVKTLVACLRSPNTLKITHVGHDIIYRDFSTKAKRFSCCVKHVLDRLFTPVNFLSARILALLEKLIISGAKVFACYFTQRRFIITTIKEHGQDCKDALIRKINGVRLTYAN